MISALKWTDREGLIQMIWQQFDSTIIQTVQESLKSPVLDKIMIFCTRLGDYGTIWLVLAGVLCLFPKTRKNGITLLASVAIGTAVGNLLIKPLFGRLRPFQADPSILLLIDRPDGFSFPSGHALSSFAASSSLLVNRQAGRKTALLLALLIAFSRVYLSVHYPSDVLVGSLLGLVSGFFVTTLVNRLAQSKAEQSRQRQAKRNRP